MIINVMSILKIWAKSGNTSIKFLSFVCYDIWKNFPQTSLQLLTIQSLFLLHSPHIPKPDPEDTLT